MKPAVKILWHESSNHLVAIDLATYGFPLLKILDEEVKMNPFYCYLLEWILKYYGWIDLGDL